MFYSRKENNRRRKEYRLKHPDKEREYRERYKKRHPEKYLENGRRSYRNWISKPENLAKKKEYQRQWYQRVKKKQEQETRKELYRIRDILKEKEYVVDEFNTLGLRKDKANKYFFYVSEKGKVKFVSDKYSSINKCVKCAIDYV